MKRLTTLLCALSLCFLSSEISEGAVYFGAGTAFRVTSRLTQLAWAVCPASAVGNECLLLSRLCDSCARHIFTRLFNNTSPLSPPIPLSQTSWHRNRQLLSQIPASSEQDDQLLSFLEKRWLAKANGFYTAEVDRVCPAFGYSVQVHPETTSSYARDPRTKSTQTYRNRVAAWKQRLPHPASFPLILTRPFPLQDYLPPGIAVPQQEEISKTVDRLTAQKGGAKVVVDLTRVFEEVEPGKWLQRWNNYKDLFSKGCEERGIDPNQLLCIQRVQTQEIGGLRILPLTSSIEQDHRFLLSWVSHLGLSANPVELDRGFFSPHSSFPAISMPHPSRQDFVAALHSFDQTWQSNRPEKTLMVRGALHVVKGLLDNLTDDQWRERIHSPTRSALVTLSLEKINEQLQLLSQEKEDSFFFDTVAHVEQILSNFCSLLEIFSPFTASDFSLIYLDRLASIPPPLKSLTTCAVHSSAMTSIAGIFKAVERSVGKTPRVLYGENTYFECVMIAHDLSNASPIAEAIEKDWNQVDLILAKFNPVLVRTEFLIPTYRVERIGDVLHRALDARGGKPLTLALDCTIDFLDSPRVGQLLEEFQEEILRGALNIVCFRSGLKFDLFGMDNYAGAPFFMVHNRDPKWAPFDPLSSDPLLLTDPLSVNWFCLAYKFAAPYLELYRKQIFDNTRLLLNKVPPRLFELNAPYRVTPFDPAADSAFIDIRVTGPLHQIRCAALVGGTLYLKCMEGGHPVFYRRSLGFYHPNFGILFGQENSSVRLTVGLDPSQIDLLTHCFETIDRLNGPP